jgi:hypothetical protein
MLSKWSHKSQLTRPASNKSAWRPSTFAVSVPRLRPHECSPHWSVRWCISPS